MKSETIDLKMTEIFGYNVYDTGIERDVDKAGRIVVPKGLRVIIDLFPGVYYEMIVAHGT